jgi:urease accessory protein
VQSGVGSVLQGRNWLPRTQGAIRLGLTGRGIEVMHQAGAARVRFPRPAAGGIEAVLINTAGGLTGGDRIDIDVTLAQAGEATVTTAAAEKIYRARDAEPAAIGVSLRLLSATRLNWLPQPTILFDRARLRRRTDVALAGDATLLALEILIFGRSAMGEEVAQGAVHDAWRIRREGALVFAETFRLEGAIGEALQRKATLNGARATALLLYAAGDAASRLGEAQARVAELAVCGGASAWNGLLVVRAMAEDGGSLQRHMGALAAWLGERPLPRVWHA